MFHRSAAALFTIAAIMLSACSPPAIADLEHDKVIVQADITADPADIASEAARGCAIHGRTAVPVSKSCSDGRCTFFNYLFACKP